jgi:acetyl esterase/lipase
MSLKQYLSGLWFKIAMSLPGPLQVVLAGGAPVTARGNTMDSSVQLLAHFSAAHPSLDTYPIDIARAAGSAGYSVLSRPPRSNVETADIEIDCASGLIPARITKPIGGRTSETMVLFFHPGGWVIGDLDSGHAFCTEVCAASGATVISVDYRLAPEHRFPCAADDAIAAYYWALESAASYGCAPAKIIVAGESAGGNLAAVVCQQAKLAGRQQPLSQFLVSPVTDVKNRSESYTDLSDAFPLNANLMEWFIANYISAEEEAGDPKASPLLATDFSDLAPAIVVTAGFDPLVDEGAAYATKLKEAGVDVQYHCETGAGHGILTMAGLSRSSGAASDRCVSLLVDQIAALA